MERDRSIRLDLDVGVYAPAEDTFLMLSALEIRKGERALEMGCGSGHIALHMAKAGASVTAVDVDPLAAENTRKNAELNRLEIVVLISDLFQNVPGTYDLLVFNPPYLRGIVEGQEDLCWAGGEDGVTITARFLQEAKGHLATGGRAIIIVSSDCEGEAMERALSGWKIRKLASQNLFFERLDVLELTL
ncbi:MAG: methyltransferase [Methanomassiliicoccales archaeon]|nr:methyltransferase [Methanomassiliicoccales archaeon]